MKKPLTELVLLLLFVATPLVAQDSVEALRARVAKGEVAEVRESLRTLTEAGKATFEHLVLGARLAIGAQDGRTAFHLIGLMKGMKPDDPRCFTWEGHATIMLAEKSRILAGASFADAATHYQEARAKGGDPYQHALWEADARMRAGDLDGALGAVDVALERDSADLGAAPLKARLLLKLERGTEAVAALEPCFRSHKANEEVALLYLQTQLATGMKPRIREAFETIVAEHPALVSAYDALLAALGNDKPEGLALMRDIFGRILERNPNDPVPVFYMASLASLEGRFEDSLALYKRFRDLRPRAGSGHYWVGSLYIHLGRLEEARQSLLKAGAMGNIKPASLCTQWRRLVAAHVALNDYGAAISLQRLVLSLERTAAEMLNMGVLQLAGGDLQSALRTYRGILAWEEGLEFTDEAKAENYLGLALWGAGRQAEALAAFDRGLEAIEEDEDTLENKGVLLIELNRRPEALKALDVVIASERDRDRTRARYHRLRILHPDLIEGPR